MSRFNSKIKDVSILLISVMCKVCMYIEEVIVKDMELHETKEMDER